MSEPLPSTQYHTRITYESRQRGGKIARKSIEPPKVVRGGYQLPRVQLTVSAVGEWRLYINDSSTPMEPTDCEVSLWLQLQAAKG